MTEITDNTQALINALERIEELEEQIAEARELMREVVEAANKGLHEIHEDAEPLFDGIDNMQAYLEGKEE